MENELHLSGSVGGPFWPEAPYFDYMSVAAWLDGRAGDITVYLNSGGGDAAEGQAIYAALVRYPGKVTVVIVGCAASAASLIAMAGDEVVMTLGSWMLLHDPAVPFTDGRGTAADHARTQSMLEAIAVGYASVYADRTGNSEAACREMMRKETLLTADAAVQMGFATRIDEAAAAEAVTAFDYRIYGNVPQAARDVADGLGAFLGKQAVLAMIASAARTQKEESMNMRATATPPGVEPDGQKIRMTADQVVKIHNSAKIAGMSVDEANALIEKGHTFEMAIDAITMHWQKKGDTDQPMRGATARVTRDARDPHALLDRISDAIAAKVGARMGLKNEPTVGREFMELGFVDMMGLQLEARGVRARTPGEIVQMAASHTASDFPIAVSSGLTSVVRNLGNSAPVAIGQCSTTIEADDYRTGNAVSLSAATVPGLVLEDADIAYTTINDEGEVKAVPADYAHIFRISNQALVNDSTALGLLSEAARAMSNSAIELKRQRLIAPLVANSGAGQTMRDGLALFHATHGNLAGAGAVISVATISAGRAAMRRQKDSNGRVLNIEPRYILVPPEQETLAQQVVGDIMASQVSNVNPFSGKLEVLAEPGLSAALPWYLVGDPSQVDGLVMAELSGAGGPRIEAKPGWESLGMEFRLVWSIGTAFHAYHGWYRNPGA